jgi:L-2-amino-thiazoline-4-carboxylic acid hydrolase
VVAGPRGEPVRREAGQIIRKVRRGRAGDTFELNVTGCRYAEFYQELGAPELGFLLTCSADFPFAEGFGGEVELTRTQTIMQGADHCDFRYRLKRAPEERS